ncbi:MAG: flagellar hook capping FlgD N-terminal domain-containing protein [Spirochaetota bacterium]
MENNSAAITNSVKKQNTNNTITNSPRKNKVGNENLDKDAFLKLLVTELRHQDPTQPMENKEFISQMAQFSALEQMTNVNKSIQQLNKTSRSAEAYSLLGKNVKAFDPASGIKVEGAVTSIFYKNDEIRLMVNGKEIGLNDIHSVYTNDPENKTGKANVTDYNPKDNKNNNDTNKAGN